MINRKLYGPRWWKQRRGINYCIAIERQERGVLHFHVLLADPGLVELLRHGWFKQDNGRWGNELNEMWNELAGFARIEAIKQSELVTRYVSKYVVKGGEIDLGGPLMQRRLEQGRGGTNATPGPRGGRDTGTHSDSVPVPPGDGRVRELPHTTPFPVASHPSSLQAGSAQGRTGNVEPQEHSGNMGDSITPECAPVSAS
jgi:hypothetical protein